MVDSAPTSPGTSPKSDRESPALDALERAAHVLPDQGPIGVFVHHNTLHAFSHLPFHEAVARGAELHGAEPYMSEETFQRLHAQGRIAAEDIDAAIADICPHDALVVDTPSWQLGRRELYRLAMLHPIHAETAEGLRYLLEEEALDTRLAADVPAAHRARIIAEGARHAGKHKDKGTGDHGRDDEAIAVKALWQRCCRLAPRPRPEPDRGFELGRDGTHRDLLLRITGEDTNQLVHPMLIPLCGAFLDRGMAYWPMPDREHGFYRAVRTLMVGAPMAPWLEPAVRAFEDQAKREQTPLDVVTQALGHLGVPQAAYESYLTRLLLDLPGWAGMMSRLERHPEDRPAHCPHITLLDYVAVRLVIEQAAVARVARDTLGWDGALARLHERHGPSARLPGRAANHGDGHHNGAYRLFRVLCLCGVSAERAAELGAGEARAIVAELDMFDSLARRRTFQEAYERHHRREVLDALAEHRQGVSFERPAEPPRFQVVVCIDEREESLRRHLEELGPDIETFGAAGFFGLAMDFRGIDDAHHAPLCPVSLVPAHEVVEAPHEDDHHVHQRRVARRRLWARIVHGTHIGSRSLVRGHLFTLALGSVTALSMTTRVLFPRAWGRLRRAMAELFLPRPRTVLRSMLEADEAEARSERGKMLGFSLDECVDRVVALFRGMGLTRGFAPLVAVLGHGSTSLNNPHESAHDCGACSGRRGGPNARVFAEMANRPEVRAGLRARGIDVPDTTWFVGGMHDTASDAVTLYDTERVPAPLTQELDALRKLLDQARALDAHERCRRFDTAPRSLTPAQALAHVEARAEHLAEPRPEYGHATNALCIVGRRALTRGLFLDRRAFLVSYDPEDDPDCAILEQTLASVGPVGAGISLEYYFSYVDNERYGCGTKLPHNVTGLLGVMNGPASDLRTGLPWQMVEIHEPVRLLTIVEARPDQLLAIAERQPGVRELVVNRWIQLVSVDPQTGAMHVFTDSGFVPYQPAPGRLAVAATSMAWYGGRADHLPPACIEAGQAAQKQGLHHAA